jgi:hypothetical protein
MELTKKARDYRTAIERNLDLVAAEMRQIEPSPWRAVVLKELAHTVYHLTDLRKQAKFSLSVPHSDAEVLGVVGSPDTRLLEATPRPAEHE